MIAFFILSWQDKTFWESATLKIVFKGKFNSLDDLPKGVLPAHAVKFREPESMLALNLAVLPYFVVPIVLFALALLVKTLLHSQIGGINVFSIWGIVLSLVMIYPHELLHAIAFPQKAEVEVWYSLKYMVAFCVSTYPTTKARFIWLSVLPALTLGVVPLALWTALPPAATVFSTGLLSFSVFSLLYCCGDFMNVKNALTQMPRGSVTQLSGMNSYWYFPIGHNQGSSL